MNNEFVKGLKSIQVALYLQNKHSEANLTPPELYVSAPHLPIALSHLFTRARRHASQRRAMTLNGRRNPHVWHTFLLHSSEPISNVPSYRPLPIST